MAASEGPTVDVDVQPLEPEPEQDPQSGQPRSQQHALPGFRPVDLFGGAMSSHICSRFVDVATFRQVPDSQEVFVDTASLGSLTVELLERQGGTDSEAMLRLWHDAAEQNDVDLTDPAALLLLGSGPVHPNAGEQPVHGMGEYVAATYQAHGWMSAKSGVKPGPPQDKQAVDGVAVAMVLLRLATFETDMLITYNLPAPRPDTPRTTEHVAPLWPRDPSISSCAPCSHNDILGAFYATHDPAKTVDQISKIIAKRNDGGPFWWPKLCDAVQKKYDGAPVSLELALSRPSNISDGDCNALSAADATCKLVWREALEILRSFVVYCKLHDTCLFDVSGGD